ncbi:hypothetical protein DMN64_07845 [Campylobacter upsaliensis]|nr:hypothetical protein [Campylobacter upsaliensis]EAL4152746.1 hypothetical protein [Campylobacter upsaliensis]
MTILLTTAPQNLYSRRQDCSTFSALRTQTALKALLTYEKFLFRVIKESLSIKNPQSLALWII